MKHYWIAVASADHVARGVAGEFMQVCHGKKAPLQRIRAGDWVLYYSSVQQFQSKAPLQAFTAIGKVRAGSVYQADMGNGFYPFRRDVDFIPAKAAAIRPLLRQLSFIEDVAHWGYPFRFGLFSIPESDFSVIAKAMECSESVLNGVSEAAESSRQPNFF